MPCHAMPCAMPHLLCLYVLVRTTRFRQTRQTTKEDDEMRREEKREENVKWKEKKCSVACFLSWRLLSSCAAKKNLCSPWRRQWQSSGGDTVTLRPPSHPIQPNTMQRKEWQNSKWNENSKNSIDFCFVVWKGPILVHFSFSHITTAVTAFPSLDRETT